MKRIPVRTLVSGCSAIVGLAIAAQETRTPQVMHQMPGPAGVELKTPEVIVPMNSFGGRPVVSVRLNGKGPYRFVLDTGAGGSVMKEELADTLALEMLGEARVASPMDSANRHDPDGAVRVPASGPQGTPTRGAPRSAGRLVRIGRLEMGDAAVSGLPMVATDLSRVFPASDDPAGVLSVQIFSGDLVVFDYPHNRIELRPGSLPAPNGVDTFEYEEAQRIPTLRISVAGIPMEAHLDSGSARGLTLPGALATRLPLGGPLVDAGKARTVDGEMTVRQAPLEGAVRIGRFQADNPTVSFAEGTTVANIGYDILRRFAITMDPRNRRFRLEEAAR